MRKLLFAFFASVILFSCKDKTDTPSKESSHDPMVKSATADKPQAVEFADSKYATMGREQLDKMEKKDIEGWGNAFADNAVWTWSSGDSLAGKKAIVDYWKNRMSNVIETMKLENDIWMPIKVNKPQRPGHDMEGTWLLGWYQFNTKYKNGKSLSGWTHVDMHYDNNGKVDRAIQYIDRAPINAALGAK